MAAASTNTQEQKEDFLSEMCYDVVENIYDYLDLKSLLAMSRTSERFLACARTYFGYKYKSLDIVCGTDGFYHHQNDVTEFSAFIRKISIWIGDPNVYEFIQSKVLSSVEHVKLYYASLRPEVANANIFKEVKKIELFDCSTSENFHDTFLVQWKNVQSLTIVDDRATQDPIIGNNNDWLLQRYANLQHFGLELNQRSDEIEHLNLFLRENWAIKSFAINSGLLSGNVEQFVQSGIQLQTFTVKVQSSNDSFEFFDQLRQLKEREFYQELILEFDYIDNLREIGAVLVSLNGLIGLKINDSSCIGKSSIQLAQDLQQLQFLEFNYAMMDDIIPFIEYGRNLDKISAQSVESGAYFDDNILNMEKLNQLRKKCGNKSKLTFIVNEDVFFATIFSPNSTKLEFIELKKF